MSADNGIYILRTKRPPIKKGNCYTNQHGLYEYRVAHCSAIDNLAYSDLYMPYYFGTSPVYTEESPAMDLAVEIEENVGYTEYGISLVAKDCYFPNMTSRAAEKALDCYIGAKPLDI